MMLLHFYNPDLTGFVYHQQPMYHPQCLSSTTIGPIFADVSNNGAIPNYHTSIPTNSMHDSNTSAIPRSIHLNNVIPF